MARSNTPNWQFRDGRPRWIASPRLREAGWRGRDLKDAAGLWLSEGASIDAARAINAAVDAWRRGALIDAAFAAMAPAGACALPEHGGRPGAGRPAAPDRLAVGALIDGFLASDETSGLADATRRFYRGGLKRLVDVLAGWPRPPGRAEPAPRHAAYAAAVAKVRAFSILSLEPSEDADGVHDVFYDAYWTLKRESGEHQAHAVLRAASAWLGWVRERKTRAVRNWAVEVSKTTPPGRIRVATWPELAALVTAAEQLHLPSIADSVILGVDLSWSQVDRLNLTWPQIRDGRAHTARQKTGRVGGTPFLALGLRRLETIRARQRQLVNNRQTQLGPTVRVPITHVLWCERTAAPWQPDHYRHVFAEVRARAALTLPSVAGVRDQDLRDTAFSLGRQAGLNDDQTASRTLQSRAQVKALGDSAYGEIGAEIADQGKAALDRYIEPFARAVGL